MKKVIYVCSPLKHDHYKNVQKARIYCRFVVSRGHIPLAVHLLFPQFLDDDKEADRECGMSMGLELLQKCDELWSFGKSASEGMQREIDEALKLGVTIRRFDAACCEDEYYG